jgi:hypothetical protein
MYGDANEVAPIDVPAPLGNEVDLGIQVDSDLDSDHAGENFTWRSGTGLVIYLNTDPIVWSSKHQPTVESSVFGAEFVAMENSNENICGIRYKL